MNKYNRKTVSTITPPSFLAVSVADMKAFLNLETSADDALLEAFIEAATDAVRRYIKRSILTETLELQMDGFPNYDDDALIRLGPGVHTGHYPSLLGFGNEFDLPYAPVASVTSITVFDRANASALVDAGLYSVDLFGGRVYLNEGETWPTDLRVRDAVKVRYIVGTAAADVPKPILHAIKQHVAIMYECRMSCELPAGCKAMLQGFRRIDDMGFV